MDKIYIVLFKATKALYNATIHSLSHSQTGGWLSMQQDVSVFCDIFNQIKGNLIWLLGPIDGPRSLDSNFGEQKWIY